MRKGKREDGMMSNNTLQKRINEHLLREQEERKNRQRSGKFNPSSFGRCYRAQIWNRANEPVTDAPDERSLRIFRAGQLFHDFVQSFIPDNQIEVEVETKNVKGFADIVSKDCVYDIKSQHSRAFWWMKHPSYDIKKEKYNNWLQVAFYAIRLKKPKMSLVFISKDDLCVEEYIEQTKNWDKPLRNELRSLNRYWMNFQKDKRLPVAKPRAYGGKECKYCSFKTKCEGLGRVENNKKIIKI